MGVNVMMEELERLVPKGLKSVLLFAVTSLPKVWNPVTKSLEHLKLIIDAL